MGTFEDTADRGLRASEGRFAFFGDDIYFFVGALLRGATGDDSTELSVYSDDDEMEASVIRVLRGGSMATPWSRAVHVGRLVGNFGGAFAFESPSAALTMRLPRRP